MVIDLIQKYLIRKEENDGPNSFYSDMEYVKIILNTLLNEGKKETFELFRIVASKTCDGYPNRESCFQKAKLRDRDRGYMTSVENPEKTYFFDVEKSCYNCQEIDIDSILTILEFSELIKTAGFEHFLSVEGSLICLNKFDITEKGKEALETKNFLDVETFYKK